MIPFIRPLTYSATATDLLQQLCLLPALVYLQDQHQPCIAFLPESYWKFLGDTAYFYQRQADFSYLCHQQITSHDAHEYILKWQSKHLNPQHQNTLTGFTGGFIGFISYDDGVNFHLKQPIHKRPQISSFLGCYRSFIRIENNQVVFYSDEANAQLIFDFIQSHLAQQQHPKQFVLKQPCQARWNKTDYQHAFQQVQNYIIAGDCYQINLTQEFTSQTEGDLLSVAPHLWQHTQAPYAGYLKLDDFELLSCSPELFIEWTQPNLIKTRPIKGTMPRHHDIKIDEYNRQKLQNSQKDHAENVMIVDLLRNDLSIYAELGTVKTTKLFEIESFNQVHHLVSEIQAQLKPIHPYHLLMTALPGGSITGAPKIRAMQIIDELEQNARGAYCGSLGYFNFDGTGRWNILIRTIQQQNNQLSLWAGGGITIASNVDAEYQECFDKVGTILNILNQYQQR